METETLIKFIIGTALVCATPGPNMLLVMSASINYGFKRSLFTMAGCLIAVCILISMSAAGLGALLIASPKLFEVIKILGVLYLIYIGFNSIKNYKSISGFASDNLDFKKTNIENFKKAFLVGISNPKAIIFAIAYFSQFISSEKSFAVQFSILFIFFIILECLCYLAYAMGGKALTKLITNNKFRYSINIAIGILFIFFGLALLFWKIG